MLASTYEHIFAVDDKASRFVVDEYASMGLPGCDGSVDCVRVGWDKCHSPYMNMNCGQESYPSVVREVVCTSQKSIQLVSCAHPGWPPGMTNKLPAQIPP